MGILHVVPTFVGLGDDVYQASFWLDVDPTPDATDIAEISVNITDWLQDMYDNISAIVRTTITAAEYIVYFHDLVTGQDSFYFDGGWTFAGTTGGESFPPQVAATISAARIGNDRPGQKRMIPMSEGSAAQGIITAGSLASLGAFATQWVGVRPPSAGFTYTPGAPTTATPQTFHAFNGVVTVREDMGTVRSRKRGVGS